jgi:7-cyano-7-deazaguanine synthase
MTRAVVLHSGGLDSTTLIAQAMEDGCKDILLLSIRYGSIHNNAEGLAAQQVFEWMQREYDDVTFNRLVVEMPATIFTGEKSALMGEIDMPKLTYKEITEGQGPSPTVVPFRNANLLSIATAIADARDYNYVYIGAHGEDAHNWAYPDCTPEFLGAMANAIYIGTYDKVRLRFPFIWMVKAQIVSLANELGAPLEMTWSCYDPAMVDDGEYIHCGQCPTCIERANAFAQAGFLDPTTYLIALEDILDETVESLDELQEWEQ